MGGPPVNGDHLLHSAYLSSTRQLTMILKNYLLKFNSQVGRHTGELISMDLVNTTQKFRLEKKVGIKDFINRIYVTICTAGLDG